MRSHTAPFRHYLEDVLLIGIFEDISIAWWKFMPWCGHSQTLSIIVMAVGWCCQTCRF
jgi:hypothetical protein